MASSSGGPAATHKSRRHDNHHHTRIEPLLAHDSHHHHHQDGGVAADTTAFSAPVYFRPTSTSRRNNNPSLSSSSSFSSLNSSSSNGSLSFGSFTLPDDSPFSTPVRTPLTRFSGVPFSWEQIPGKPKNEEPTKKQESPSSSSLLLPPPPANNNSSFRKNFNKETLLTDSFVNVSPRKSSYDPNESFRKDPFFAALVECSKDDVHLHRKYWNGSSSSSTKMVPSSKSTLSGRLGFISMYSSCKMTCGVAESVILVPRRRSSSAYNLINRRSI